MHGFGGRNSLLGKLEFMEGNRLRCSRLASTQKARLNVAVESEFLKVIETADGASSAEACSR